jgi:hypothetical protein
MLAIGFSLFADPSDNSTYFICNFNDTVTTLELNELKTQGFQVIKDKNTSSHVILVICELNEAIFSTELKNKMKELIMVDEFGNRTNLVEQKLTPDLLNLFFNFI